MLACLALLVAGCATAQSRTTPIPGEGEAPAQEKYGLDFEAYDTDGRSVDLAQNRGRLILLTFVADWCKPCHDLAPGLVRVVHGFAERGESLQLLGVLWERRDPAKGDERLLHPGGQVEGFPFPVVRVPYGVSEGESVLGDLPGLPITWLVGRTGVPLYRYRGGDPAVLSAIADDLARYLGVERRFSR